MVFLVRRTVAENFEIKKKIDRIRTLKNEQKENGRMRGKSKSNNSDKHLWFYLLYKKIYFARKHSLKKISLYHHILFTVFMGCKIYEPQ